MTGRIDAKKATESNKPKAKEAVDHPDHYNFGPIECVDYIISCGYGKGFCIGNALKYLARAERKKNPAEDLEKAKWYSEYARMIMVAEAGNAKTKEELHILSLLPKKENR
ncbi:MAG: DUF3310 domain-containing protein [Deltaproteobacteria bacterium]|nr:DUF3310 domain-containing protein [Deltaproteobacteria bacterium]